MNRQDLYDRAWAALNEAAFDDARWPEAAKRMDEACGAKGNIVVTGDNGAAGEVGISMARIYFRGQRSVYWERRYFDRLYAVDERIPRLRQLPHGRLVAVRSLYTEDERRQSVVYNEMARAEVRNGLNMRLALPDGAKITWQIGDPADGGGWGSDRLAMIEGLKPHLLQFARVRRPLAQADALGRSMEALLENKRVGVVQLERRGRIVAASDTALAHLRPGPLLRDKGGFLHAASKADDGDLQKLLGRALGASGARAEGGSMWLRRSRVAPVMVHVTPVAASGADRGPGRVAALALIVDAEPPRVDLGLLEAVLGLRPAEAEVAALLARRCRKTSPARSGSFPTWTSDR